MSVLLCFTVATTPNANGVYAARCTLSSEDHPEINNNYVYGYKPSKQIRDNNELRTRIGCSLRQDAINKNPELADETIKVKCLNPASDFLSRREMWNQRGHTAKYREMFAGKPKGESKEEKKEPTAPTNKREFEVKQIQAADGTEYWTIVKSELELFSEEEARNKLFEMQMEALNG